MVMAAKKEITGNKKKIKSSYEELMEDKEQKELFDKEYKDLLLSELILAAMEEDHVSVRRLAAAAGVSPTIIQGLKSGERKNITVDTLSKVLDSIGYEMSFQRKSQPRK